MSQNKGFIHRLKSVILGNEEQNNASKKPVSSESEEVDVLFADKFTQAGGYFVFCESNLEMVENLSLLMQEKEWKVLFSDDDHLNGILRHAGISYKNLLGLNECQARITPCEGLIANNGLIMMSPRSDKGRQLAACPKAHIVVAYTSQLAFTRETAIENINKLTNNQVAVNYSFLSGPNKSGNSEKELHALGSSTPSELYLFLVED